MPTKFRRGSVPMTLGCKVQLLQPNPPQLKVNFHPQHSSRLNLLPKELHASVSYWRPDQVAQTSPGKAAPAATHTMKRRWQLQRAAHRARPLPRGPTRRLRTRATGGAALPPPTPPPFPHPRRASRVTPSYFPLVGKLLGSSGHAENRLGEIVGAARAAPEGRKARAGPWGRGRAERAVPVILLILARVDLGSLCELLYVAVLVHVLHGGGAVGEWLVARSAGPGGSCGGALYGAGFKMAAEEIRPPPAPSLYSRPARQSGGLLDGDVARAPARPLSGGAGSKRREERGELPGRPRPPMGEAAGGESSGSGGEQWRRHMGEPGRDLHRGAPGEERGGAGGQAERPGAIRRASPRRRKSRAAPSQGHSPSCLESLLCLASGSAHSRPAPSVPQCGAAATAAAATARLLQEKGGVHPKLQRARPPSRPAHACSVLAPDPR